MKEAFRCIRSKANRVGFQCQEAPLSLSCHVMSFCERAVSGGGIVTSQHHIGRTSFLFFLSCINLLSIVVGAGSCVAEFFWLWQTALIYSVPIWAFYWIPFHSVPLHSTYHLWNSANCVLLSSSPWFSSSSFFRPSLLFGQNKPSGIYLIGLQSTAELFQPLTKHCSWGFCLRSSSVLQLVKLN